MELELAPREAILASQVTTWPKATKQEKGVIDLLVQCRVLLDGPTGKCLHPALAELLESLRAHGRLTASDDTITSLLRMTPATITLRLRPYRAGLVSPKGICHTQPGLMLKASIPVKTWAEWEYPEAPNDTDRTALALRLAQADPVTIRDQIALIQANLLELARHRGQKERRAKRDAVYVSHTKLSKRASPHEATTPTKWAS